MLSLLLAVEDSGDTHLEPPGRARANTGLTDGGFPAWGGVTERVFT